MHTVALTSAWEPYLDRITDLMQDHERAAVGEVDTAAAEVRAMLADPEVDRQASVLAFGDDDRHTLLGLRLMTVISAEREVAVDCWVSPHLTRRRQVAVMAELTGGVVATAGALAAADVPKTPPDGSVEAEDSDTGVWQLAAGAYREDAVWAAALAALGLARVRTFERLRIEHGLSVAVEQPPPGVVVTDAAGEEGLRSFHRLHQTAFADHWGGEPERPFDEWLRWRQSQAGYRSDLWRVAELGGEPVGFCCGSDIRSDFGVAYIPLLGVVRGARGRGIARYLLHDQFALSAERGFSATELTVDSASRTGADRLYRSVGMRPYRIMDVWRCPLR